ncbi:MAG: MipA/OmpV family protein [Nitrospirae bacterium]|nr:MipA/OmpV family protein [Nitrospirota bacterium]
MALLLMVLLSPLPARAETPPPENPKPLWEVGIGGGWASFPPYPGSGERRSLGLALPYVVYRGSILRASGRSARVVLLERPRQWVDLSGGGWLSVNSSEDPSRAGMPDRDYTIQAGPRWNLRLANAPEVTARLAAHGVWSVGGIGRWHPRGALLEPSLGIGRRDSGLPTGPRLTVGAVFASANANGYLYDVPTAHATATRPAFKAGSGLAWTFARLALNWNPRPDLRAEVFVSARHLGGSAIEASPLVRRDTWVSAGFDLVWVFQRSRRTVPDRPLGGD